MRAAPDRLFYETNPIAAVQKTLSTRGDLKVDVAEAIGLLTACTLSRSATPSFNRGNERPVEVARTIPDLPLRQGSWMDVKADTKPSSRS
jgi:hypothetical protein